MKQTGKKIIAIVGPTATGKSDLALKLAKKFRGEIISADSRAIYRGLDIGTAKVPGKWTKRGSRRLFIYKSVTHHMVDFLSPAKAFSAYEFSKRTVRTIQRINLPIIAGGTGFWIEALANPSLLASSPPDQELRSLLQRMTVHNLFYKLRKLDPARAATAERSNKRRLIRALEIAASPPLRRTPPLSYDILYLGLTLPNKKLKDRIHKRLLVWLDEGLIEETQKLIRQVSEERLREIGMQYPVIADYIAGKISKDEMIARSVNAIYHYAKRQKTWFKRNKNIHWITSYRKAETLVRSFITQEGKPSQY